MQIMGNPEDKYMMKKRNKRILYVANTDIPSRMANSVQVMKNADAWATTCPDTTIITCTTFRKFLKFDHQYIQHFYGLKNYFPIKAYPLHALFVSRWRILRGLFYRLVAHHCKMLQPDLIFTRSYLLPLFLKDKEACVIVEMHGPPDDNPDKLDLYEAIKDGRVDAIVTISDVLANLYQKAGLPKNRIIVLPDGFDAEQFKNPIEQEKAVAMLDLPGDRLIAGYVGHLYDHRGVEEIIKAAKQCPDILFLLVGGHDEDILRWKQRIKTAGLDNVILQGFVANSQVPLFLQAADFLLMPYSRNCPTADWMSPLKLFEYMAAERAIISSNLSALTDIIQDGVNGLVCEPDDSECLVDKIRLLQKDGILRKRLGEQARSDVAQFSWQNRIERLFIELEQRGLIN